MTVAYGNLLVAGPHGFPPARERRENEKGLPQNPERLWREAGCNFKICVILRYCVSFSFGGRTDSGSFRAILSNLWVTFVSLYVILYMSFCVAWPQPADLI